MSIVSTRYGTMRVLDSDQIVSRSLALYGEWAQDEVSLLANFVSAGSCVLDVGAFIGTHALAFSKLLGAQGKVFSFEPRREIYAVLCENLATNECANVTALNLGLGKQNRKLILSCIDLQSNANFGGLSLTDAAVTTAGYEVDVSTLDELHIERIDLLKIDVEGMEREVLDGAMHSISRHRPVIFCECNSINSGSQLLQFCQQNGYAAFAFLAAAFNRDNFNHVQENIFEDSKELGLLLVPKEKLPVALSEQVLSRLCPIGGLEDLVLPLLHKPQYAHEVLATTAAGGSLGISFPSPAVDKHVAEAVVLMQEIARLQAEVQRVKSTVSWKATKPFRALFNLSRSLFRG
jgi:FkbM family methyltransferase